MFMHIIIVHMIMHIMHNMIMPISIHITKHIVTIIMHVYAYYDYCAYDYAYYA